MMIVVTGANGQLGRRVIASLLERVPASQVAAAVRRPEAATDLAALGVQLRRADYSDPALLDAAFQGAARLLLISSSEVGQRVAQHRQVIEAAQRAQVGLLAYTSLLHAERSPLGLADEHRETERLIRASGLAHVLLRNGWYTENYVGSVPGILALGDLYGCAGQGRIASAPRQDYAEAAAVVLTQPGHAGQIYELAGDSGFTLAEFAAELGRLARRDLHYIDLPEAAYEEALRQAGLPEGLAAMLADSERGAASGGLFDDSRQLSRLIGRPTTPWTDTLKAALA